MSEEKKEKTTRDLSPSESVDFLVRRSCMIIPQGANPQDMVKEYEYLGDKIKEAFEK